MTSRIRDWLNEPTTRRAFVLPWVGVVIALVLSLSALSYQGEARAYDQCVSRVNTRDDVRLVFSSFINELGDDQAGKDYLFTVLDTSYPKLDAEQCVKPSFF